MESASVLELSEIVRQKDEEILRKTETITGIEREKAILEDKLTAIDLHMEEREAERSFLLSFQQQLTTLQETLTASREMLVDLQAERDSLQLLLAEATTKIQILQTDLQQHQSSEARILELEDQVSVLLGTRDGLMASVAETSRQLEVAKSERDQHGNRLEAANEELTSLKNHLDLARQESFTRDSIARNLPRLGNPESL